ncbi:MAG: 2,3,4,5-tetrahydropyridine-2-carboxylate N-succinyltransferase, partial [Myxococcota bacterium]
MNDRQTIISAAFEDRSRLEEAREAVLSTVKDLDEGRIRVAEPLGKPGEWRVNSWVKQAILLYFRLQKVEIMEGGDLRFRDLMPTKTNLEAAGIRVVPPGVARYGSFLEKGVIMMPSFVNIGAYVGAGSMVDTWATVGSCAQIGAGVHLSGGVGIGGVLEPPGATPVIIED